MEAFVFGVCIGVCISVVIGQILSKKKIAKIDKAVSSEFSKLESATVSEYGVNTPTEVENYDDEGNPAGTTTVIVRALPDNQVKSAFESMRNVVLNIRTL